MTKHILKTIVSFILFLIFTVPAFAQQKMDPILLDEPNENIYSCKNDIFIEVLTPAAIGKQFASRTAENQYFYLTVNILYLAEKPMAGLDRSSFCLIHMDDNNDEIVYPLNFAITMISNRIKGNNSMNKNLKLPAFWKLDLVFDIDTLDKNNWTLVFAPTARGTNDTYCQIDVPLTVR